MKSKKSILIIGLFFLAVIAVLFFAANDEPEKKTVSFSDLAADKIDVKIPASFPQDVTFVNARLLDFYRREQKTGDITAVVGSGWPAENNFAYYLDYGKKTGWQIIEARELSQNIPAKLLLKKENFIISLAIEKADNSNSIITISSTSIIKTDSPKLDLKDFKLE